MGIIAPYKQFQVQYDDDDVIFVVILSSVLDIKHLAYDGNFQ